LSSCPTTSLEVGQAGQQPWRVFCEWLSQLGVRVARGAISGLAGAHAMLGELKTVNGLAAGGGEQEADAASLRALQASKSPAGAAEPKASGLCGCGCGRKTTIARWNDPVRGKVRGQPMRFIRGHSSRRPEHIARLVARIQPQGSGLLRFRVDPATGCWLWSGSIGTGGYGQIWADGKVHWAHRYAYEQVRGKVPGATDYATHAATGDASTRTTWSRSRGERSPATASLPG
jgi:hypothetical protein